MKARDVTGVILAGGRGARMGGVDKGLVEFEGRPIVEHVMARLRPQVSHLLISANRNIETYARYGVPVAADPVTRDAGRFDGPLAGVLAALEISTTEFLAVVPCDAPYVPVDLVARFITAQCMTPGRAWYAHDGRRAQFVFALLATTLRDSLRAYLARGDRKVELWFNEVGATVVDCSDVPDAFANINSPEDVATVLHGRTP